MNPERFHLTLTVDGRPAMHGWWASEVTARRKLAGWIGEHGRPDTRVTLVDEATGETLANWPNLVVGGPSYS